MTQKISTIRSLGNQYYRRFAKDILLTLFACAIIQIVPPMLINIFFPTSEIAGIILEMYIIVIDGPILFAEAILCLSAFRNECAGLGSIVYGFNFFKKAFNLCVNIYFRVFIGLILFFIPGIYLLLKYSLSFYVLADNPTWSARDCMKESSALMKANYGKLITLFLTYVPLMIICLIPRFVLAYYMMEEPLIVDIRAYADALLLALSTPLSNIVGLLVVIGASRFDLGLACFYDIVAGKLIFEESNNECEQVTQ